jgi:hypothetical protein
MNDYHQLHATRCESLNLLRVVRRRIDYQEPCPEHNNYCTCRSWGLRPTGHTSRCHCNDCDRRRSHAGQLLDSTYLVVADLLAAAEQITPARLDSGTRQTAIDLSLAAADDEWQTITKIAQNQNLELNMSKHLPTRDPISSIYLICKVIDHQKLGGEKDQPTKHALAS